MFWRFRVRLSEGALFTAESARGVMMLESRRIYLL